MSIPTRRSSDERVCDRQRRTSQCGFHLSESHTHSQAPEQARGGTDEHRHPYRAGNDHPHLG